MTVSIRCQTIKSVDGRIKYWIPENGGREHYHIGIWVEGNSAELDSIEKVTYLLDPSFKHNLRSSSNRANKFSITIWTWGYFPIKVTLHYKIQTEETIDFSLTYNLPVDTGKNYIQIVNT
jgi:transcription initiation factor IIF auxiliary subunit